MRTAAKWTAGVLALAVAAYIALCGWMYLHQRELLYFPQYTRSDAQGTDFALPRGSVTLRGWALNTGRHDALIYFGGNAEALTQRRAEFTQWFGTRTVYLVDYRGFGASGGTPSEADLYGDALALFDTVHKRHPGGRIAVMGRSLGSGVASYLAARRPVERVALVTPYDSIANIARGRYPWLPVGLLLRDRYDSERYISHHRGPVLVLRAGLDEVVPPSSTDRLLTQLPGARVLVFPHANHIDISDDPRYRDALAEFMH